MILLAGCGAGGRTPAAGAAPAAVTAVEVGAPAGGSAVETTGALRRRREMTLSFRIPGVMTHLAVDEGDRVRRGQLIATLDPTAVDARVRQTQADLDRARRDLERLSGLVERGAISRQQFDAQKNVVADAEAAHASALFDRRWAQLVSPSDGVVLTRTAQAGEVLQAGQAVVSIADDASPLVLRAPLADRDALGVRLGQSATVRLDALPAQPLAGTISRIGQQAGAASGEIEVEITIPVRPGLRSGLIGRASLAPAERQLADGYVRIPAEAVLEAAGSAAHVFRLDPKDSRARRTPVRFGGFEGDEALIAGLPTGARVITAGAGFVADGQRVEAIDPARLATGAGR